MSRWPIGACRSCAAPIVWAVTTTGARMPVNADLVEGGNIILYANGAQAPLAVVVAPGDHDGHLRTSHYATCPQADSWRKR